MIIAARRITIIVMTRVTRVITTKIKIIMVIVMIIVNQDNDDENDNDNDTSVLMSTSSNNNMLRTVNPSAKLIVLRETT